MSIEEFIGLFDKKKITEGKIRFLFYLPRGFPCKYWCDGEPDSNYEELVKHISEDEVLKTYSIIGLEESYFNDSENPKDRYVEVLVFLGSSL